MHNGFLRVAAAAPTVKVADVRFNLSQIKSKILELEKNGVELAVFPEMCITAYTCADLFHNSTLIDAAAEALIELRELSLGLDIHFAVGLPIRHSGALYNCAALVRNGRIDLVAKSWARPQK